LVKKNKKIGGVRDPQTPAGGDKFRDQGNVPLVLRSETALWNAFGGISDAASKPKGKKGNWLRQLWKSLSGAFVERIPLGEHSREKNAAGRLLEGEQRGKEGGQGMARRVKKKGGKVNSTSDPEKVRTGAKDIGEIRQVAGSKGRTTGPKKKGKREKKTLRD